MPPADPTPTDAEREVRNAWAMARGFDLLAPHFDDLDPVMQKAIVAATRYRASLAFAEAVALVEGMPACEIDVFGTSITPHPEQVQRNQVLAALRRRAEGSA